MLRPLYRAISRRSYDQLSALKPVFGLALARSARRIPIDHPKLEKMAGDALEMATVKRAVTQVDVVTQSLGVSAGPEVILKPTRFFSKATRVLVVKLTAQRKLSEQELRLLDQASVGTMSARDWIAVAKQIRRA